MFFTQTLDSCLLSRSTSLLYTHRLNLKVYEPLTTHPVLLSVLFVCTFSFIVIFFVFFLIVLYFRDSSTVFVSVAL